LRIVAWNLWLTPCPKIGSKVTWDRFKHIPDLLESLGADVLALQEAFFPTLRLELMRHLCKIGYVHQATSARLWRGGLLTASRFPIRASVFLAHREPTTFTERLLRKGTLLTQIDDGQGTPCTIANIHLGDAVSTDARLKQIKRLLSTLSLKFPSDRLAFAGDFNFRHLGLKLDPLPIGAEPGYDALMAEGYVDVHREFLSRHGEAERPASYSKDNSYNRAGNLPLDFIFCRGSHAIEKCHLIATEKISIAEGKSLNLSDHCGIMADIAWGS
jgi:endonuclease/exonuclease/phosphatase family metal-dependent hydrolase